MKPLKTKLRAKKLWGFDIETYGKKNDFLMGSIFGDDNICRTFWDNEKFIDFIVKKKDLFRKGYITATNLQFDILSLFKNTEHLKNIEPFIKNSNFIMCKYNIAHRESIKFLDSFNYYKFSVKRMGNIIGIDKLPKPVFLGEKIKNNLERLELEEYNLRDSVITYRFMKFLQKNFNSMNAELKLTSASTSMNLYRRNYQKEEFIKPFPFQINYMQRGYYGGRTEIFKRGHVKNLKYYDINSLYPSVMTKEFPKPSKFSIVKFLRKNALYEYEGVAYAKITAPKLYIPYLPLRHNNKLIFPIGEFKGYYTFFELREAEKLGYRIKKLYSALIYFERFTPFKEYVEELYKKRLLYKKNNDERQHIIKLFLNSLYGKFAQKTGEKEKIIHKSKVAYNLIEQNEHINWVNDWFIFKEKQERIPCFINPIFSIYTTAYARHRLYQYINKVAPKNVYYCDTDSLFTSKYIETSDRIGEMKFVCKINDGILIKPKMYVINKIPRCKGVNALDYDRFMNILYSQKILLNKFSKFKESNRRKLSYNEKITVLKHIDLEDNKRIWTERFKKDELQNSAPLSI